MALTARGKALRRMSTHRGITEEPPGSNSDHRPHVLDHRWGIRKAQEGLASWLVGLAWCGTWCAWGLRAAGVKGVSYRLASVALIEDDARARRAPFWDWQPASSWRKVLRGDLVVWFGRGVHVEMVRGFKQSGGQVYVITEGGNTSSGVAGSQSNGGGSYRRVRPLSQAHGFARVDYPGGASKTVRALNWFGAQADKLWNRAPLEGFSAAQSRDMPVSDKLLVDGLRGADGDAVQLSKAMLDAGM